jgi:hypothetical protein
MASAAGLVARGIALKLRTSFELQDLDKYIFSFVVIGCLSVSLAVIIAFAFAFG